MGRKAVCSAAPASAVARRDRAGTRLDRPTIHLLMTTQTDNGITISDRGRISAEIREQYLRANA